MSLPDPHAGQVGGSQASRAAHHLRMAILEGELEPGERLNLKQLSDRWQVSVTPIREAIRELAAEGLIEHQPQRAARVLPVSHREATEIYELRLLLEPGAVERSLANADAEWEADLTAAFTALDAVDPEDRAAYIDQHRQFHVAVRAACDSQWLLRIVQQLTDHSDRYRALGRIPQGDARHVAEEHRAMYRACLSRDVALVVDLTREHLQATLDSIAPMKRQNGAS